MNPKAEQLKLGEEKYVNDHNANNYLFQYIDRTILEMILNKVTSKDIWNSMKQKHTRSSKVERAQLHVM